MKRQRGSAILFVVVFLTAITTVLVAAAGLSANAIKVQTRREEAAANLNLFDGAADQVLCDYAKGTLALPNTRNVTLGNSTMAITVTDNSAVTAHTMKVVGSMTTNGGRSYAFNRIVGMRKAPSPLYYALAVNGNMSTNFAIVTGVSSANGDMLINGSSSFLLAGSQINGDLETNGLNALLGLTVTGGTYQGLPAVPFPALTRANYSAAASTTLAAGATIGTTTFASSGAGLYKITYVGGNCNISGTFTGCGCIYVAGSVTITGNIAYGNASSCMTIIAEGNISAGTLATSIAGFYYTPGQFSTATLLGTTVSRGEVACGSLSILSGITIKGDPWIWNTPTEGQRLRVPGLWP